MVWLFVAICACVSGIGWSPAFCCRRWKRFWNGKLMTMGMTPRVYSSRVKKSWMVSVLAGATLLVLGDPALGAGAPPAARSCETFTDRSASFDMKRSGRFPEMNAEPLSWQLTRVVSDRKLRESDIPVI